jgi:hypothetical protein
MGVAYREGTLQQKSEIPAMEQGSRFREYRQGIESISKLLDNLRIDRDRVGDENAGTLDLIRKVVSELHTIEPASVEQSDRNPNQEKRSPDLLAVPPTAQSSSASPYDFSIVNLD